VIKVVKKSSSSSSKEIPPKTPQNNPSEPSKDSVVPQNEAKNGGLEDETEIFPLGGDPKEDAVSAVERTEALLRISLPIDSLEAQDNNPNEMSEQEFNLLYDNVAKAGITDPILCRKKAPEEITPEAPAAYRIVGGHHRWEVAKLHGFEEVPVTVITDPTFDADQEKFQVIRHNVIRGKLNPKKFMDLYESLSGKYSSEVAAEMFGFADEEQFRKLVQSTAQALPPEMKQSFIDASKEIRTIDDLSLVLNRLFSTYGDTVPYGYMIFDYGGNDHVWLRLKKGQKKSLVEFAEKCREMNRTIDSGMAALLSVVAGGFGEDLEEAIRSYPEVTIAATEDEEIPTEDYLAAIDSAEGL